MNETAQQYTQRILGYIEGQQPLAVQAATAKKLERIMTNYRNPLVVNGVGRWNPSVGRIPLSDGVGIVTATGNGASQVYSG
jgi:hypothetical protein